MNVIALPSAAALEVGAALSSWRDWSADGLVHLYGQEIIPGSTYEVQIVDRGCENTLGDPTCYSTPLVGVATVAVSNH